MFFVAVFCVVVGVFVYNSGDNVGKVSTQFSCDESILEETEKQEIAAELSYIEEEEAPARITGGTQRYNGFYGSLADGDSATVTLSLPASSQNVTAS